MPSSLFQMLQSIFSDNNSNIMLAAIISLLLVILFVLLLHLYAQWFLSHAHHRRRLRRPSSSAVTVSDVIGPARFHHFHTFNNLHSPFPISPSKGLHSSSISKIPLFVYQPHTLAQNFHDPDHLECVICLSVFENGETGRILPKCGHAFHVGCIDMWLTSHSNCPICRAPILELQDHDDSSSSSSSAAAVLEVVIDSTSSEIGNENDRGTDQSISVSADDDGDDDHGGGGGVSVSVSVSVSESVVSISETSSSLLGCSLKRMFSQVFPSSNVTELGTS